MLKHTSRPGNSGRHNYTPDFSWKHLPVNLLKDEAQPVTYPTPKRSQIIRESATVPPFWYHSNLVKSDARTVPLREVAVHQIGKHSIVTVKVRATLLTRER